MVDEVVVERASETLFLARMGDVVVGRARIAVGDGVWEAYSTVVEPTHRGHRIGAHLAEALLDAAAEAGVTVIPSCWFIDGYLERHSQKYGHLRAPQHVDAVGSIDMPACRIAPAVVHE